MCSEWWSCRHKRNVNIFSVFNIPMYFVSVSSRVSIPLEVVNDTSDREVRKYIQYLYCFKLHFLPSKLVLQSSVKSKECFL